MASYKDEAFSTARLRERMADLPLPNPAVVIDVRADITQPYDLVWNLATEIEDLTKEMYQQQVKRWRYLANSIDFLRINPLPPDRSLMETPHFDVMKRNQETQSFAKKEDLAALIGRDYVDRVRNLRIQATQDTGETPGDYSGAGSAMDPARATVRVFFLVDLMNEASLRSAASYATLLKNRDRVLDKMGRAQRVTITAICLNADPEYRKQLYEAQDSAVPLPAPLTIFDMAILIQSYRDDDAYIAREAQENEMELILYMLLLAPPEQLIENSTFSSERQIQQDMLRRSEKEFEPVPCPMYLLGISSLEYSGRWGARYLNYGLARKTLHILQDARDLEQGDLLLQRPDNKEDWLKEWWAELEDVADRASAPFMPERESLDTFQKQITAQPFEAGTPLLQSVSLFQLYRQRMQQHYKIITNALRGASDEQYTQVAAALAKLAQERTTKKGFFTEDPAAEEILVLLEEAEHIPVTLFRGAAGALPRARYQLTELAARIGTLERLARKPVEFARFSEEFETQTNQVQQEFARMFQTWKLPIFGRVLRSTVLLALTFMAAAILLFLILAQIPLAFSPVTRPLFLGISPLFIVLLLALLLGLWFSLQASRQRKRRKRAGMMHVLASLASTHATQIRAAFRARLGLLILEQAGIYKPDGEMCRYMQHLQTLEKQLDASRERALLQQQRAYERLYLTLGNEQIGMAKEMPWMVLNSRRDILHWKQFVQKLQEVSKLLSEEDEFFSALARELLFLIGTQNRPAERALSAKGGRGDGKDDHWQFHLVGTELVAVMILANTLGYSLEYVQSVIDRYLALQVEPGEADEVPMLTEHILALQEDLKDAMLEETLRDNIDNRYQRHLFYLARSNNSGTVEEKLGDWIEFQYLQDEDTRQLLRPISITARLKAFRVPPARILEDLENRCKLLGYREQAEGSDAERFYFLLTPEPISKEFAEELNSMRASYIQRLSFPDREKLVYVQAHRMHSGIPEEFLITNAK